MEKKSKSNLSPDFYAQSKSEKNSNNNSSKNNVLKRSVDFEITLNQMIRRSEKRAWLVAVCSLFASVMLAVSYIFIMPLKEKQPYLIVTDSYTGTATLSKIRNSIKDHEVSRSEIVNKGHVARYVMARESYDWDITGRRDWDVVHAMGNESINAAYAVKFSENNPYNPDILFGQSKVARVRIKSIVLTSLSENYFNGATVRFDRVIIQKVSNKIEKAESFIATLGFDYVKNLSMPENYLIENPLGFQVQSYRLDPDIAPDQAALTRELTESFQKLGAIGAR